MKKSFLILALVTLVSTKAFADFGLGAKVYVNFHDISGGGGLTLGLGSQRDNAFMIDLLVGTHGGDIDITAIFDWHALRWNIGIIQLYLGLGLGTTVEFDPHTYVNDADALGFSIYAHLPVGVKIFLDSFEIFLELGTQLGWGLNSWTIYPDTGGHRRVDNSIFHWDVGLSTGFRVWF